MTKLESIHRKIDEAASSGDWVEAVRCCREGVSGLSRGQFPEWFALRFRLARFLQKDVGGDPIVNLREAIAIYQELLLEVDEDRNPDRWAGIQLGLGYVYLRKELHGLERSITHFRKALKVFGRGQYPERWAMIQAGIGLAYAERTEGIRAANILQSINHYEHTLEVYTNEEHPEDREDSLKAIRVLKEILGQLAASDGGVDTSSNSTFQSK